MWYEKPMEHINHNANRRTCWSRGEGERESRTCDNVWTWLVRWTINWSYFERQRGGERGKERERGLATQSKLAANEISIFHTLWSLEWWGSCLASSSQGDTSKGCIWYSNIQDMPGHVPFLDSYSQFSARLASFAFNPVERPVSERSILYTKLAP